MKNTINKILLGLMLALAVQAAWAVETITYYHNDALGSPVAATDANGAILWKEDYHPYGSRLREESTDSNQAWYTGKHHEKDVGLTYFGARWYDPTIGRFMAIDPVGFKAGNIHSHNRYAYANNNPYLFVDPDGEFPVFALAFLAADIYLNYQSTGTVGGALKETAKGLINPLKKIKVFSRIGSKVKSAFSGRGTNGASGELTTASNKKYLGNSTGSSASGGNSRAPMHPETQKALDGVKKPSRTHGHCCEIDAINKALNKGDKVGGAKMGPVKLNESGRTLGPCSTCREVKKSLGVD